MPETDGAAFLLPPLWLLVDDGEALEAMHLLDGTRVEARGRLRTGLLGDTGPSAGDEALGAIDASLGRLLAARGAASPVRLDRASVLEGNGWKRLFVELTGTCNERCTHCYASAGPEVAEALDRRTIEAVLVDAAAMGFGSVQLTGGDPLLSPHCVYAAQRARDLGIPIIEVFTNGLALGRAVYGGLREAGVRFAFSIYSHDPVRHDDVTKTPGSLESTARAIRRALEGGSTVRVGVVLMEGDVDHEERTRSFVEGLGVPTDSVRTALSRHVGRGTLAAGDLLKKRRASAPTHDLGGIAAVAYDGTVHPCIFGRDIALGNVRSEGLSTILGAREPIAVPVLTKLARSMATPHPALSCWECRFRSSLLRPGAR